MKASFKASTFGGVRRKANIKKIRGHLNNSCFVRVSLYLRLKCRVAGDEWWEERGLGVNLRDLSGIK